ncbi:unnamed protein product [Amoebophrya sp. A25]|nr:unnamed protein product [Amoebophrya sp. A25]|eukprot:GSA25T00006864001.1
MSKIKYRTKNYGLSYLDCLLFEMFLGQLLEHDHNAVLFEEDGHNSASLEYHAFPRKRRKVSCDHTRSRETAGFDLLTDKINGRSTSTWRIKRSPRTTFILSEIGALSEFDPLTVASPENFAPPPSTSGTAQSVASSKAIAPTQANYGFLSDLLPETIAGPVRAALTAAGTSMASPLDAGLKGVDDLKNAVTNSVHIATRGKLSDVASDAEVGAVIAKMHGDQLAASITKSTAGKGVFGGGKQIGENLSKGLFDLDTKLKEMHELKSIFDPAGPRFSHKLVPRDELKRLQNVLPFWRSPWQTMLGTKPVMAYDITLSAIASAKDTLKMIQDLIQSGSEVIKNVQLAFKTLLAFMDQMANLPDFFGKLFEIIKGFFDAILEIVKLSTPMALFSLVQMLKGATGLLRLLETTKYPMDVFIPAAPQRIPLDDVEWMAKRKKYPMNGRVLTDIGARGGNVLDDPRPASVILRRAQLDADQAERSFRRADIFSRRADFFAQQAKHAADAATRLAARTRRIEMSFL